MKTPDRHLNKLSGFRIESGMTPFESLEFQEVLQQVWALGGQEALGVELHAFEGEVLVTYAHNLVLVGAGGNLKAIGHGVGLDG